MIKSGRYFFLLILFITLPFFVFLMISFSFPDLFALFYVPNLLFKGNIYSLVKMQKNTCVWLDATYPPLYYLTIGIYLKTVEFLKLLPSSLFEKDFCPVWQLILDKKFLFWAKFPLLFFHFFSAWIFSLIIGSNKKKWFLFWLVNPITIFVTLIQGQFEIIPTFFLLLSLFLLKKERLFLSFLFLGVGAAFKNFPFFLLPVYLTYVDKNILKKILFFLISLIPYLISSLFFLGEDFFRSFSFSENFKMLNYGFLLGKTKISVYPILYLVLLITFYFKKNKNFNILIKNCFLFYLIYFLTTFWFPQRLLFLIPLLLLTASFNKKMIPLIVFLSFAYFTYILILFPGLFDHVLLRPIFPGLMSMNYGFEQVSWLRSVVFGVITAVLILLGFLSFSRKEEIVFIENSHIFWEIFPMVSYLLTVFVLLFLSHSI